MTKDKLEYWHEKLFDLAIDMNTSPTDHIERAIWVDLLEAIDTARVALRRLHGDWKSTEAFKNQKKHATDHA